MNQIKLVVKVNKKNKDIKLIKMKKIIKKNYEPFSTKIGDELRVTCSRP
jgi:hypothetical protein